MVKTFFSKETGAITLFVLLAMLFFLIVIFSMFMSSSNKYWLFFILCGYIYIT